MKDKMIISTPRWAGKMWLNVTACKKAGGSMVCAGEADARNIAERWGGTARRADRWVAASPRYPNPKPTWFVDFKKEGA